MNVTKKLKHSHQKKHKPAQTESLKFMSDIEHIDIKKPYDIDDTNFTEAYYSSRYGWTLRKSIE